MSDPISREDRTDAAMLQSMAASFRARMDFSFNPDDMAALLDRCAEVVKPGPRALPVSVEEIGQSSSADNDLPRVSPVKEIGPGGAISREAAQQPSPIVALRRIALETLAQCDEGYCLSLKGFLGRCGTPIHPEIVRGIMADLRQNGLVMHCRGLMTEDGEMAGSGWGITPAGEAFLRALPPAQEAAPAPEDEEAYQIGLRDGYEKAVQDIDILTGGDGEYFDSTIPGEGCPNAGAMKRRIADRFSAHPAAPVVKVKPPARPTFPILGSRGAQIDLQLVKDHGGQAHQNHYQSVDRLAARGGLSWSELHAVLHNRPFQKMDQNDAMITCRALEARYLAALEGGEA